MNTNTICFFPFYKKATFEVSTIIVMLLASYKDISVLICTQRCHNWFKTDYVY